MDPVTIENHRAGSSERDASVADQDVRGAAPGSAGASPAGDPIVEVRNLGKTYLPSPWWLRFMLRSAIKDPVVALDDVSFTVHPGTICAVVGPNGAGKSTLFRLLTGLTTATTGGATILGYDAGTAASKIRRHLGFMPSDDRSLWLRQTCAQNLEFHGALQGMTPKQIRNRTIEVLDQVGLAHAVDRVGFALSAGMRARLQLARALLHEPAVVILDEPTATVDPVGAYELLTLIQDLTLAHGLAVLISSHRLEEIEALHDQVLLLDHGRLVHSGNLDSLRETWDKPRITFAFADPDASKRAALLLGHLGLVDIDDGDNATVVVTTDRSAGELLAALGPELDRVRSVHEDRLPLRELLAQMYGVTPRRRRGVDE